MSQLALAHERNLIHRGCSLRLCVMNPSNSELTKAKSPNTPNKNVPSGIKLQMVRKGSKKDEYVDIDFDLFDIGVQE